MNIRKGCFKHKIDGDMYSADTCVLVGAINVDGSVAEFSCMYGVDV